MGAPQIEITFHNSGYGITELTALGSPPFTVLNEDGVVKFTVTTVSEGKEIVVMDTDGDGIPEQRLTLYRDDAGKTTKIVVEQIRVSFEQSREQEMRAEPHGTSNAVHRTPNSRSTP
jgi:hypothetical protein